MTATNRGPGAEERESTPAEQPRSCARCGHDNPPDAKFCENCGATVEATEPPSAACPHCGRKNLADALFCEACGGGVAEASGPATSRPRSRTGLLIAVVALLIAAVIGGAVAAIVVITGGSSHKSAASPTTTAARPTTASNTTPTESGFPNGDESALLEHVPSQIASSCDRKTTTAPDDAVAAVFCTPTRPDLAVSYYQFSGPDALRSWYAGEVDFWQVQRDSGSCQTRAFTAEFDYTISDVPAGRYLCTLDRDRDPWIEWTDTRLDIGAEAFRQDGRGDLLWRAWKCCLGPNR